MLPLLFLCVQQTAISESLFCTNALIAHWVDGAMLEQVTSFGLRVFIQGDVRNRTSLLTESLGIEFDFSRSSSYLTWVFSVVVVSVCFFC